MYYLGEHDQDEYVHLFFSTKEKALEFLEKEHPEGWHGKLRESDIEEIELDDL